MSAVKLHIVSFDIPYPADYGGVIDVWYKIKSLAEAGCEIYLHCFEYGRGQTEKLKEYCKEVWYYPRLTGMNGLSLHYPYIVYSRRNNMLLQRLQTIEAPILFEGIHCCYYADHPSLKTRMKLLRAHNVEHEYYRQLAQKTSGFTAKLYYRAEAFLLKKWEHTLQHVQTILCLSLTDKEKFHVMYSGKHVEFVAPFHPYTADHIPTGSGDYCLYHGNLSHPENEEAVIFLLTQVIPQLPKTTFVIAGKNPSGRIQQLSEQLPNCRLIANPDEETMNGLIRDAQIHVLPTFQRSGMKLKLLYALFHGRHVIVNSQMLYGTGLQKVCTIAHTSREFASAIDILSGKEFTEAMKVERTSLLNLHYNNRENAEKIITFLQQKSL